MALGRALLSRPRLLLLDEPTTGLDPERARRALGRIREQVRSVRSGFGVPLLVVTHRPEEAAALATEVLLLGEGHVRDSGPTREVLLRAALGPGAAAETLIEARVTVHDRGSGVTRVELAGEGAARVSIPHTPDLAVGQAVLLAVGADEVLVATRRPEGLSARNAVEAAIDALEPSGDGFLLRSGAWLAHLTPEAVRELGLAPGGLVWLITKTHSWRIVAG